MYARWEEIVGLVDVTVPGWRYPTAIRVVRSNGVKNRGAYVYLDPMIDKYADGVFKKRDVVSIVPVG